MPKIKFSQLYDKLCTIRDDPIKTAWLLGVYEIHLEDQHPLFIAYDTDDIYKLPSKGKYLMLLFLKPQEEGMPATNLFTTLRRHTLQKYNYYRKLVGQEFKIVLDV